MAAPVRSPAARAVLRAPADDPIPVRERWPDVAKGLCILMVVLWHVVIKHYQPVDWTTAVPVSAAWGLLVEQLMPVRMPLFFAISGLFAVGVLRRPWPALLRTRVLRFGTLYAGWLLLQTALLPLAPDFPTAHAADPWQLLAQLTVSPTNLWYLLALGVYFAIAKALQRVPTPWVLAGAFLLSATAAAQLIPNEGNRWQVLQNLLFFLAGSRLAPAIRSFARTLRVRDAFAITAGTATLLTAIRLLHADEWPGAWPVVSLAGAATGIAWAVLLTRAVGGTARVLERLGTRTLPLYVLHLPALALIDLLARPLLRSARSDLLLAVVEPVLVTALVVVVCLLVERLIRRCGLGRMFDPFGSSRSVEDVSRAARGPHGRPAPAGRWSARCRPRSARPRSAAAIPGSRARPRA